MTERRRIFVHIGAHKTGSSALQAYLSLNSTKLRELGFSYPFPENSDTIKTGVCTGNILHVMQGIAREEGRQLGIDKLSEIYLKRVLDFSICKEDYKNIIISGEFLTRVSNDHTLSVLEQTSDIHDLTVILYVRDIYWHVISSWKQVVKASSQEYDVDQFVERKIADRELSFQRLNVFLASSLNIEIRNYDFHRGDLVGSFLELIGINRRRTELRELQRPEKNPSLSFWQAKTIVLAQQCVRSPLLTATMLNRFRAQVDKRPDPYIPDLDNRILGALGDTIAQLNDRLPIGEKLRDTPLSASAIADQFRESDLQVLLGAVAEVLADHQQRASGSDASFGLPPKFDPKVYLLRNPDVAAAGMDPVYHYLNHGRFEGRPIGSAVKDDE